jgi:hypothetical protein
VLDVYRRGRQAAPVALEGSTKSSMPPTAATRAPEVMILAGMNLI